MTGPAAGAMNPTWVDRAGGSKATGGSSSASAAVSSATRASDRRCSSCMRRYANQPRLAAITRAAMVTINMTFILSAT